MSARTKSIPRRARRIERRHQQVAGRRANDVDVLALQEENKKLKAGNKRLAKENARLQKEAEQWFADAQKQEEQRHHWQKRYFLRDQEATELAGLLSLREARIAELEKETNQKNARIKELTAKLTGNKASSEKGSLDKAKKQQIHPQKKRKRGRQEGAPGYGRHTHDDLEIGDESITDVDPSDLICPDCGDVFDEVGSEDSYEVEIEVKGYRRKHTRKKRGHFCKKKGRWVTKTAKPSPKIWPKAGFGVSVWVFLLIGKFILHTPVHRVCIQLLMAGIRISEGTIVAGFMRIEKLIDPLIEEITRYSREEKHHWHIDDTGWKVFVMLDDKSGFGWYLWVFLSQDVCVYVLSPSRGRKVPQAHLENSVGVATSDRLSSNMKLGDNVINSYCWVHIRRELRELAVAHPEIVQVCGKFLALIASLYHYNKERLLCQPDSDEHAKAQEKLLKTVEQIEKDCQAHLAEPNLHEELRRLFTGMLKDWDGLKLFLDLPEIPPDNNPAERALRGPKVGLKNYNGSGSQQSARFTAKMLTLSQTLKLNGINEKDFLTEYLRACAIHGGKAPPNAKDFLPWRKKSLQSEDIPP